MIEGGAYSPTPRGIYPAISTHIWVERVRYCTTTRQRNAVHSSPHGLSHTSLCLLSLKVEPVPTLQLTFSKTPRIWCTG